ncbi:tryptophan 2,3-dioxygenase family protein [Halosaccharopolyspora lacisalsi]|nr:tryptophan 2,3-dioxygenase family protein [Halosaccharopolyspora lacisalsi]
MTYSRYLHLETLLDLQHPLTPPEQQDLHDSERLFIVIHQASETLLGQALTDLRHIEADRCARQCLARRVDRATQLIDAMEGQLRVLRRTLDPDDFAVFRERLGTASGLQSAQFHELFAVVERLTPHADRHVPVAFRRLETLRTAVRRWRCTHLDLVEHMIGGSSGTGRTSGTDYLERRLNGPAGGDTVRTATSAAPRASS